MSKTFFDEELRERPLDLAATQKIFKKTASNIEYLRQLLEQAPGEENLARLGRELQRGGECLRLLEEYEQAQEYKREAIVIWELLQRERAYFLTRLQLGVLYGEAGKAREALVLYKELFFDINDKTELYRDFLNEGLARACFTLGDYAGALNAMERALEIRSLRGNRRHIQQTEELRNTIRSRLT